MISKSSSMFSVLRKYDFHRNVRFQVSRNYIKKDGITPSVSGRLGSYRLRLIKEADIPEIMKIRRKMDLTDCASCLKSWCKLDPEGMLMVEHETGEIIGTMVCIICPDDYASTGLYYVKSEFRGSGVGKKLLQASFDHLGDRNYGGNSTIITTKLYQDIAGISVIENYTVMKNISNENVDFNVLSDDLPKGVSIQPFQETYLEAICNYDFNIMGYKRNDLLKLSCKEENSKTLIALKEDFCVGFGTIKLTCTGAGRVGPLYTDNAEIAEALLKALIKSFPQGKGFAMMTVSNNAFANLLMEKLSVPTVQHLVQVYGKRKVTVNIRKVFAVFDIAGSPF